MYLPWTREVIRREREIGPVAEPLAKHSCQAACEEERKLTIEHLTPAVSVPALSSSAPRPPSHPIAVSTPSDAHYVAFLTPTRTNVQSVVSGDVQCARETLPAAPVPIVASISLGICLLASIPKLMLLLLMRWRQGSMPGAPPGRMQGGGWNRELSGVQQRKAKRFGRERTIRQVVLLMTWP